MFGTDGFLDSRKGRRSRYSGVWRRHTFFGGGGGSEIMRAFVAPADSGVWRRRTFFGGGGGSEIMRAFVALVEFVSTVANHKCLDDHGCYVGAILTCDLG